MRPSSELCPSSSGFVKDPKSIGTSIASILIQVLLAFKDAAGQIRTIWRKEGNQGDKWLQDEIEVFLEPPHMVIFLEAEAEDWKYGGKTHAKSLNFSI